MARRIDQLNAGGAISPNNDLIPVWQPGETSPKTRYVTPGQIAALNNAAISQAQQAAQDAEDAAAAAQADADTAQATATAAQTTANTASSTATTANNNATTALANAATAQSTANTALSTATAAQTTANNAIPLSQKGAANGVATLDAAGKVPASQLTITGAAFKGNWDATANTPTLSDATGTGGDYYFVQNGTSRNLGSGAINWTTGALIIHDGSKWVENEATNNVLSVAGKQGAVTLDLGDVSNSASRFAVSSAVNAALAAANAPSGSNPIATIADIGPAGGVTSWNSLTGAVSATTANLNDSSNRRYVTDAQRDALAGTNGAPSGTNRYVTDSDPRLTGGGGGNTYNIEITGGYNLVTGYGDGVNQVGGQETSRLLSSLGYTNATAAARWPQTAARWGGITANATEYDEVCLQEALLTLENSRLRYLGLGTPILLVRRSAGIILPGYAAGYSNSANIPFNFVIDLMGGIVKGVAAQSFLLTSEIASQTIANRNIEHRMLIQNGTLRMFNSSGTVLRVGASYGPEFRNLYIYGGATGIFNAFCLSSGFYNVRCVNQSQYGFHIDSGGTWWTGGACELAGNQPRFYNCMVKVGDTNGIGFYMRATDTAVLRDCLVEGNAGLGQAAVFYDDAACTVSKQLTIDNFRFELFGTGKFSDSIFKLRSNGSYKMKIRGLYLQYTRGGGDPIDLVNIECRNSSDGAARVDIEDIQYSQDANDSYTFKRTGTGWLRMRLKDVRLRGNPTTGAAMLAEPLCWGAGSNHTSTNNTIDVTPLL